MPDAHGIADINKSFSLTQDAEHSNKEDEDKNSEIDWKGNYESEAPEGAMATALFGWTTGFASLLARKPDAVIKAYRGINKDFKNPNLKYELLNINNPEKFLTKLDDYKTAREEIDRQRKIEAKKEAKSKKNGQEYKKKDFHEAGYLPIKRFRERIDFEAFDKYEQAIKLAGAVHQKINAEELKIKTLTASSVYGLDYTQHTNLEKSIKEWQKNPKGNFDDFLKKQAKSIYQSKKEPEKDGAVAKSQNEIRNEEKKILKEKEKYIDEQFKTIRSKTEEKINETMIRAYGEMDSLLKGPVLNKEELEKRIESVVNPVQQPQTVQTVASPKPAGETIPIQHEHGTIPQTAPSIVPPTTLPPVQPSAIHLANNTSLKRIGMPPRINSALGNLGGKMFGGNLGGLSGGNFMAQGLSSIAGKLGFKAAASAIGAAASLGTTAAIQAGLEALKKLPIIGERIKELENIAFDTVKMAGTAVGSIVILIIIMVTSPQIKDMMQQSSIMPTPIQYSKSFNSNRDLSQNWNDFEKNVLSLQTKQGTVPQTAGQSLIDPETPITRGQSQFGDSPQTNPQISWKEFEARYLNSAEDSSTALGMTVKGN